MSEWLVDPSLISFDEHLVEVAFEESAGVGEVFFGGGFGFGDALKDFIQNPQDSLLFGERGKYYRKLCNISLIEMRRCCAV